MTQTGELNLEAAFKQMSLRELSITASELSSTLSQTTEDEVFLKVCQEYIANATADKVDGYCFVALDLEADIADWQGKKNRLVAQLDEIIARKQRELEMVKTSLLQLYQLGLIGSKLLGKTQAITIQPNPPKIARLHIQPDSRHFPEELREVRVEYKINTKVLIERWKAGTDVGAIAQIEQGHHVRFRHKRMN